MGAEKHPAFALSYIVHFSVK